MFVYDTLPNLLETRAEKIIEVKEGELIHIKGSSTVQPRWVSAANHHSRERRIKSTARIFASS
jgi:hypothetical protein